MLRTFLFIGFTLLPTVVFAQTLGNNGFGEAGGTPNSVPELPPALLLMGASAIGYAARRIATRRHRR